METRLNDAKKHVDFMLKEVIEGVRVFQAGGTEVFGDSLKNQLEEAAKASVIRLYRDFDKADHSGWGKVYDRSRQDGAENALEAVDHSSDIEKHPVCAEIIKYIGVSKKGSEIRDNFKGAPYGWSQDAIDGGLFALLASGIVRAKDAAHKPVDNKTLDRSKLTQASFQVESITIKPVQLIQIRKLLTEAGITCHPQQELSRIPEFVLKLRQLANSAGGEAPKPEKVDASLLDAIMQESGNAQLLALYDQREALKAQFESWQQTAEKITKRMPSWGTLKQLLELSHGLAFHEELQLQYDAILSNRSLLADPDPIEPQIKSVTDKLRNAITILSDQFNSEYQLLKDQLEENANWQKLTLPQQQLILDNCEINEPDAIAINTVDELIDNLEACSIKHWNDRIQAQSNKFNSASMDAAKLLEPKVQIIKLPHRTLKTESDIKEWLAEVEQQMLKDLQNGPLVV
jgi:hypothetical protein